MKQAPKNQINNLVGSFKLGGCGFDIDEPTIQFIDTKTKNQFRVKLNPEMAQAMYWNIQPYLKRHYPDMNLGERLN